MKKTTIVLAFVCSVLSGITQAQTSQKDELVNTPGGPIKKTNVHFVEKGCYLSKENGRIKKINIKTGMVMQEYDISQTNTSEQNERTGNHQTVAQIDSTFGTGWVTYGYWNHSSGEPISYFSTDWIVPNPPTTFNYQTIFLFNGIDLPVTANGILQPVLQWGYSAAGGGNYWAITNWYVESNNVAFWGDSLIVVNPGTNLQGVMQLTAKTDSGYSYNSAFVGYPTCSLQMNNIGELTWANETMEVYGITAYTDYPPDSVVRMTNIQILTGTVTPALNWTHENVVTDVGQHTIVVSNNSTNGEVDLYFHNPSIKQIDAGIPAVALTPVTSNCNDTINLSITLKNYGLHSITTCSVNYMLDGNPVVTQTWNGSLVAGQTTTVIFPTLITSVGSHTLLCYSSNPNDSIDGESLNNSTLIHFDVVLRGVVPIVEGFELATCPSGMLPNSNWNVSHTSSGGANFQITSLAASSGTESCMLNNLINIAGDTSVLETNAVYDLASIPSPVLAFDVAYQKTTATNTDKLQILTSIDCGLSWQSRRVILSTALATLAGGTSSNPYTPAPSQFTTYTVNINSLANEHNVMFCWKFMADPINPGNNLYIDNINITQSSTGIEQIINNTDVTIYPNPNTGNFVVETNTTEKQTVQLYDVNGKLVLTQTINGKVTIDANNLALGVYNLSVIGNEGVVNKKLIIVR